MTRDKIGIIVFKNFFVFYCIRKKTSWSLCGVFCTITIWNLSFNPRLPSARSWVQMSFYPGRRSVSCIHFIISGSARPILISFSTNWPKTQRLISIHLLTCRKFWPKCSAGQEIKWDLMLGFCHCSQPTSGCHNTKKIRIKLHISEISGYVLADRFVVLYIIAGFV